MRLSLLCFALMLLVSGSAVAQAGKTKPAKPQPKSKTTTPAKPAAEKETPAANAPFMLKGFLPDFPDSLIAVLQSSSDPYFKGPKARVSNKQFLMTGTLPQPGIYNLILQDPKNQANSRYVDLFLNNEPTAIRFTGSTGMFEVLEGPSLQAFASLVSTFGTDFDTLSRLSQMRQSAGTMKYSADSINTSWNTITARIITNVPGYIEKHGSTPAAPFLLCTIWPIVNNNVDAVDGWVNSIAPAAMENDYGRTLKEYVSVEKMFGYGRVAPPFMQNDTLGKPVELLDFRGKYVLVDFWASWCGPCRQENPNVVQVYNQYKNKNFTVLGISLDKDKAPWLQAIRADGLSWTHVSDLKYWQNSVAKLYRIQSIPQNYLLDPEGKIVGKNLRGPALQEALDKYLK